MALQVSGFTANPLFAEQHQTNFSCFLARADLPRSDLTCLVSSYLEQYPQVSVNVMLAQQMPEILVSDYDVLLLCSSEPPEPGMASECLGAMSSILCASPVYLARYGIPQALDDLKQHRCMHLAGDLSSGQWMFDGPNGHEAISVGQTVLQSNLGTSEK